MSRRGSRGFRTNYAGNGKCDLVVNSRLRYQAARDDSERSQTTNMLIQQKLGDRIVPRHFIDEQETFHRPDTWWTYLRQLDNDPVLM